MRVAIYARVRTTDQTCDLYLRKSMQYITARDWGPTGRYGALAGVALRREGPSLKDC
jgi:hypothetical protein